MTAADKRRAPKGSASVGEGFHSVLVPVDLTAGSERILERVSLLPLADDVRVTLLHVVPAGLAASDQRRAERDASKALAERGRQLRRDLPKRAKLEASVVAGAPAKQISDVAVAARVELIVMGRGGGKLLRDTFVGSTAERVVRQAGRPVLVVRLAPRSGYNRPALALDLDQSAHESVRLLLRVLPRPRPPVDVIHAFDAPYQTLIYPSLPHDEAQHRLDGLRAKAAFEVSKLLGEALATAAVPPDEEPFWKTHVRQGSPRQVVEKAVNKAKNDLLVVGTHGYSGAAYVLLGTVAGDLLRASPCDVLMVPPASRGE